MNRDFRIVFVCVVIGTTLAATALAGNAGCADWMRGMELLDKDHKRR